MTWLSTAKKIKRHLKRTRNAIADTVHVSFYAAKRALTPHFPNLFQTATPAFGVDSTSPLHPQKIDLAQKRILLVVAHCDDEVIWANTVLTTPGIIQKDLVVVYDGGPTRNERIKQVAALSNARLFHIRIPEIVGPEGNARATMSDEDAALVATKLTELLTQTAYDSIFTHNFFGEYGHGHHRAVHRVTSKVALAAGLSAKLFYFGYAYPLMYCYGITPWTKTLRAFGMDKPWLKNSDEQVVPFRGIFKTKQYPEYFWHETNASLPQTNTTLMKQLVDCYKNVDDAWVAWNRKSSHYYRYCANSIQYFTDSTQHDYTPIEYTWPTDQAGKTLAPESFLTTLLDYLYFAKETLHVAEATIGSAPHHLPTLVVTALETHSLTTLITKAAAHLAPQGRMLIEGVGNPHDLILFLKDAGFLAVELWHEKQNNAFFIHCYLPPQL